MLSHDLRTSSSGNGKTYAFIQECFGNIECRLHHEYDAGDHTIFVGEAVKAWCDEGVMKDGGVDIGQVKTIHHLGGERFVWLGK